MRRIKRNSVHICHLWVSKFFDSAESAFARYKEYKEDFIKDMAQLHKDKIPQKVFDAMMNWVVEITD